MLRRDRPPLARQHTGAAAAWRGGRAARLTASACAALIALQAEDAPAQASARARDAPARERPSDAPDPPLPEGAAPRPRPEYRPTHVGPAQVLAWVPRVLLAPALVLGDMVARPVVKLATFAEKQRWRERLHETFTFGPDGRIGLYPAVYFDSGFRTIAGVYFFWYDIWRSSDIDARVTSSGPNLWDGRARWSYRLHDSRLTVSSRFILRDDAAFHGIGRGSSPDALRYGERGFDVGLGVRTPLTEQLALGLRVQQELWAFEPDVAVTGERVSLGQAIADGTLPPPAGVYDGFAALSTGLQLEVETRRGRVVARPRTAEDYAHVSGTGVALLGSLTGHWGQAPMRADPGARPRVPAWLTYGVTVTGTLDLTGTQRRLELELYSAFTDPLRPGTAVPFTRLVTLGGARPLRGFASRRFTDRSAIVATLRYRWPIWSTIDGVLHGALGNVFGARLAGFDVDELRGSFGLGVATATSPAQAFELLLAAGTESLGRGAAIESSRLAVGTTIAF